MESWETQSTEAKFTHYRHHSTQTQRYDEAVLEQDHIRSQGTGPHCHRMPQGGGPRVLREDRKGHSRAVGLFRLQRAGTSAVSRKWQES